MMKEIFIQNNKNVEVLNYDIYSQILKQFISFVPSAPLLSKVVNLEGDACRRRSGGTK